MNKLKNRLNIKTKHKQSQYINKNKKHIKYKNKTQQSQYINKYKNKTQTILIHE